MRAKSEYRNTTTGDPREWVKEFDEAIVPWLREGHGVAIADSARALSAGATIGDRWCRGRPGRIFVLEDQARYSSDGHAVVRARPQRPVDLDARAFHQASRAGVYSASGLGSRGDAGGSLL